MVSKDETAGFGIEELMDLYAPVKTQIEKRLGEFRQIWAKGSDEDLFRELVFCLLTPQSRARTCWAAVERLVRKSLIATGSAEDIHKELVGVRFSERKGITCWGPTRNAG